MNFLRSRVLTAATLAFCAGLPAAGLAAEPVVRWIGGSRPAVEVAGFDHAGREADWPRLLAVYAEPDGASAAKTSLPPMLGRYAVEGGALRFEPRFPLSAGVRYRAVFHLAEGRTIESSYRLPVVEATPETTVTQVFPSVDVLPENLLKFYLHFSAPMSRGGSYAHLRLLDEQGRAADLPFLELDEELWDPAMTRLTVLIDPGRIKRGVKPLEDAGPAIEAGKRYRLVIDPAWLDAAGKPLARGFEKVFAVGPADREPPDPARWQIETPAVASRAALTVRFPEPLDHAILQHALRVTRADGTPLAGDVRLDEGERRWTFTPAEPWPAGPLQLVVPTAIEDLAGNNVGKLFDVDLFEPVQPRLHGESVKVPLALRSAPIAEVARSLASP